MRTTTALLSFLAAAPAAARTVQQRTYANPIDIDYRYNFEQQNHGPANGSRSTWAGRMM